MFNKPSDLYRQIADQLDTITSLERQLEIQKQIIESTEEQVALSNSYKDILKADIEEDQRTIEELRSLAQHWHERYIESNRVLDVVSSVFNTYDTTAFRGLQASAVEAKGLVDISDFDIEDDYSREVDFITDQIDLADDISVIKEEYFNDKGEEAETERLLEF